MDGYGVRVEARSAADDAGRLEVRVFDDIVVTVSASPNGRALRVTTPTGNPPRGDRQARMDRYRLARTVDGKDRERHGRHGTRFSLALPPNL